MNKLLEIKSRSRKNSSRFSKAVITMVKSASSVFYPNFTTQGVEPSHLCVTPPSSQ